MYMIRNFVITRFYYHLYIVISLDCGSNVNECATMKLCTCSSTGNILRWTTSINDVFSGSGITFVSTDTVGASLTEMGVRAELIRNEIHNFTSIMDFDLTSLSQIPEVVVSCDDPQAFNIQKKVVNFNITPSGMSNKP